MSIEALVWANHQRVGHPTAKLVLMLLANQASADDIVRFVPEELADQVEVSTGTVLSSVDQLVEAGLASVMPVDDRTGQQRLQLHPQPPRHPPVAVPHRPSEVDMEGCAGGA